VPLVGWLARHLELKLNMRQARNLHTHRQQWQQGVKQQRTQTNSRLCTVAGCLAVASSQYGLTLPSLMASEGEHYISPPPPLPCLSPPSPLSPSPLAMSLPPPPLNTSKAQPPKQSPTPPPKNTPW